jgi:hypothetical protein
MVAVAAGGSAAVPAPVAMPTVGVVVYPIPPEVNVIVSMRYPTTAVTVRLPQPVRFVSVAGFASYPVPGSSIVTLFTAPEPFLNVIEPENPLPLSPSRPTPVTVVPFLEEHAPVTVQLTTQDGVDSRVVNAVAPEPPPEKETNGGDA